jgi:hypothetical protein
MRFLLTTAFALAALPAAGAPVLGTPVDCELGNDCYIQNYVDHDANNGYTDFTCGGLSYDGHKGTDFALPSLTAMQMGVDVLASAGGVVTGIRDGMDDIAFTADREDAIRGRDCGNGVVVAHGDGWETQYCHMKKGSVAVESGDKVSTGQRLGEVGLSGRTQFPHLHISLRQDGRVVDPFAPTITTGIDQCGASSDESLWADPLAYRAGGLIRIGFETGIPSYSDVKSGVAGDAEIGVQAEALVVFALGFGSRAGDVLDITISGPTGEILSQSITLEKSQAQYFRATGRRTPSRGWPKGSYIGTVTLTRGGHLLDQTTAPVSLK